MQNFKTPAGIHNPDIFARPFCLLARSSTNKARLPANPQAASSTSRSKAGLPAYTLAGSSTARSNLSFLRIPEPIPTKLCPVPSQAHKPRNAGPASETPAEYTTNFPNPRHSTTGRMLLLSMHPTSPQKVSGNLCERDRGFTEIRKHIMPRCRGGPSNFVPGGFG